MTETDLPLSVELSSNVTAVEAFRRLRKLPHVVFFDSAALHPQQGRYSFIAADPFAWFEPPADAVDPIGDLRRQWERYQQPTRADLPPFQGGVAGLLGYGLCRSVERVPKARYNDLPTPPLAVGFYDVVAAFDHVEGKAWLISQGWPESSLAKRRERAERRLADFQTLVEGDAPCRERQPDDGDARRVDRDRLAPQFPVAHQTVVSNLSAGKYREMVQRGIDYIHAGDVFQVNLAQRLLCPAKDPSTELYLRLREKNPAPYAGYLDLGATQICSASPECFLTLRDRQVETRPIKGTRGRSSHAEADLFSGDELLDSEKDRAENVMIVDLLRNDLSRVCLPESVHVAQLCRLETYAFVKHLVSVVRGQLPSERTPFDLMRAAFPGGSITGAPKIRAMEIIAELEPTARGPYCGSLAYVGFNGQMDSSILIRTVTVGHGWWQFQVGGGIVSQSDPDEEYAETWHKARGMLAALSG